MTENRSTEKERTLPRKDGKKKESERPSCAANLGVDRRFCRWSARLRRFSMTMILCFTVGLAHAFLWSDSDAFATEEPPATKEFSIPASMSTGISGDTAVPPAGVERADAFIGEWGYFYFLSQLAFLVALTILFSGLDDLFIDTYYWVRRFYRFIFFRNVYQPPTLEQLTAKPEQTIAVMIPAWHEADVIANMLETNLKLIQYENYMFFVGVYENDPATSHEVDQVIAKNRRHKDAILPPIRKVTVPHAGPTCKADCLNWIIQAVFLFEKQSGHNFSMIVMHDSEDVIHPYEFRLYNYLVPRKDLIQLPVRCLETKWHDFVRGTYIDEFSEFHTKDMVVRESLVGIVPSAGVSTCFSRKSINYLCQDSGDQPFDTDTLTEDYDVSYRLRKFKDIQQIFVVFPVSVELTGRIYSRSRSHTRRSKLIPIATAELFPNRMYPAIRQRTRWNIGIFFQACSSLTWRGGLFSKYYFIRDRKGVFTNIVMFPAYFLLVNFLVIWMGAKIFDWPTYVFNLPIWLVFINTFLLANRVFQRAYFTRHLYGNTQGILSFPRILFSNILNFFATTRAIWIFAGHRLTGRRIAWDKTTHDYPSFQLLEKHYKKLGVVLVEKNILSEEQLNEILEEQKICHLPLGHLVKAKKLISEDQLMEIVCAQFGYSPGNVQDVDPEQAIQLLPPDIILEEEIIPFAVIGNTILEVMVSRVLTSSRVTDRVSRCGYTAINPFAISIAEMNRLLTQIRRLRDGEKRLGDLLLHEGLATEEQIQAAITEHRIKQISLGACLVASGVIARDDLLRVLAVQTGYPIGSPNDAMSPQDAVDVLHPAVMTYHRIYPVSVDEQSNQLTILVSHSISERVQLAAFDHGYDGLIPLIVLDENINQLLEKLDTYIKTSKTEIVKKQTAWQTPARKFGHYLLENRFISYEQLNRMLQEQKKTNRHLEDLLIENGILQKAEMEEVLSKYSPQ